MALKSKNQEEIEEPIAEQISFDDLEFEAEYIDKEDEETEPKVYYTISGKESQYEPEWEQYGVNDLDPETTMEGKPEIRIIEKDDKTYNALHLKVMDDGEILNCYFNFPKKDYPYLKRLNKEFDFYRPCFDFIYNILKYRDERNVVDKNGEEINIFNTVNLETFAKYVDQMELVGVRITEGNPDDDYNGWEIYKME